MIRLYAFADGLAALPDEVGVGGAPLAAARSAGLTVIVTYELATTPGDPRDDAVAHGLVVEALARSAAAVLPVRFGETFPDEAALNAAVARSAQRVREALELVRGRVEIGVRVTSRQRAAVPTTGTAYLRTRLAELGRGTALHDRLQTLACATVEAPGGETAFLVDRADAEAARALVRAFADEHPELSVVCTGPWAPYNFGGGRV
jgi:hypothetical protein